MAIIKNIKQANKEKKKLVQISTETEIFTVKVSKIQGIRKSLKGDW